ncbi:beta-N-acetylglucosaminidase domain-containing protein [Streptomyces sp. NPDC088785]|uniref:beta-N-acetylglucosaminidase domain-containing protein n=1 Tax=Streptomyces sp. NPDC088785 TaxID=3365897 RepID=UPI003828B49B
MQLRRKATAAAVAVAVVAGTLGGAGGAAGATAAPPGPGGAAGTRSAAPAPPPVWPRPRWMRTAGPGVAVPHTPGGVALVVPPGTDRYAVDALRTLLGGAGAREVREVTGGAAVPSGPRLVVLAGSAAPGLPAGAAGHRLTVPGPRAGSPDAALRGLGATARGGLPAGGYRLAVGSVAGRPTVALEGVGADGLFHGVQTLRQLTGGRQIAGVVVRDWPETPVRGLTEGFYGTPWTPEQRLAQLDFMGRTKQNRYLYAPGDDPYRQARWREPYPAARRAEFRALAARARADHVTLGWAVAPGQAMCLTSAADLAALDRKLDAMWALGVRAFQLQFQDVSYSEWHCAADAREFGSGPGAAAGAQARVANAVAGHLAERHPDAEPLSLMPTEYYQDGATRYRAALARGLDDAVQVAWTGVGVVPRTITGGELAAARRAFGSSGATHPLLTMDNYPVNDYAQDRLLLGPYTGRDPAVATGSAALLANAMERPAASRVALFTAADYAWNPRGYRPGESWRAAIDDLAGGAPRARAALAALAANDASSVLGARESAYLRPLVAAFWRSRTAPDPARARAARALRDAFAAMRAVPQGLAGTALAAEVRPWSDTLGGYGRAGEAAVDMLEATARGDGPAAWAAARRVERLRGALAARRVTVGAGVLAPFLTRARAAFAAWSGTSGPDAAAGPEARLPRVRALSTVTVLSAPGARGTVEAHVPGAGWQRLGALADGGFTELGAGGTRADAVRVAGAPAGAVDHVVPWYADTPPAALSLARSEADAEIGGGPRRVTAHLTARRPAGIAGRVTARAPHGIGAATPEETGLPRGTAVDVPVEITVARGTPAGVYAVPVSFGGATRTVTVRAYPRTAGPDLARTATASSSADETGAFPARNAADGRARTRWSSPARDGQWWQAEFTGPVRLGRVVLRWQDAYPSRYRVLTSADGRAWHTAATVRDGRGGRETVRMDARDTRFVRVVGDGRATRYGISLWTVRAYAVADPGADARARPRD